MLKRLYKAFKYTSIILISLVALLYFLLQTSWVQQWLAQKATAWLSEDMGTEVSIGKVRLELLRSVIAEDLFIKDQTGDTLIYAGKLELILKEISTTKSQIRLRSIQASNAIVHFEKHKDHKEWNYDFFIRYVDPPRKGPRKTGPGWRILIEGLQAENCTFRYKNNNKELETDRFDLNWMEFSNIYAKADEFKFEEDTVSLRVKQASLHEKCGLNLTRFQGMIAIHPRFIAVSDFTAQTPSSLIGKELTLRFTGYNDLGHFADSVQLSARLDSTHIHTADLLLFNPAVNQISSMDFQIQGDINGKLPSLRMKNLEIRYGSNSVLKGKGKMTGLPDFDQTLMDFKIQEAHTVAADIELFSGPGSLPSNIRKLGAVDYTGEFIGYYTDFVAFGNFSTLLGNGKTDINLKLGTTDQTTAYSGNIELYHFDFGAFFNVPPEQAGKASLKATVNGTGLLLQNTDAIIDAEISQADINGYNYTNGKIKGRFSKRKLNGDVTIDDPNLQLNANGVINLESSIPKFKVDANIQLARLGALHLDTISSNLKAQITADISGNHPDNLLGDLHIQDLIYERGGQLFDYNRIDFSSRQGSSGIREVTLRSPIADADLVGYFEVDHMEGAIKHYLHQYFPEQIEEVPLQDQDEDFELELHIKDPRLISNLFLPDFDGKDIHLDMDFNSKDYDANLTLNASYFSWKKYGLELHQLQADIWNEDPSRLNATINCSQLSLLDSVFEGSLSSKAALSKNNIYSTLLLSDTIHDQSCNILSMVDFADQNFNIRFDSSHIKYKSLFFDIQPNGRILVNKERIAFNEFSMLNQNQRININGIVHQETSDDLDIQIQQLQLAPIQSLLDPGFTYNGLVNGTFHFTRFSSSPLFTADLLVNDAQIAKDTLGDIRLTSEYDDQNHLLNLNASLTKGKLSGASVRGTILTDKEQDYLNLRFRADDASMSLVYIFFADYLENVSGTFSARGTVTGSFNDPKLMGEIFLNQPQFTVSYLQSTYKALGSITFNEKEIKFLNTQLTDLKGGKATVGGEIRHELFSKFYLDIRVNDMNNIQVLNTSPLDNTLYFGTAYVTGKAFFTGPTDNVFMKIRARSEKNTRVYIPLNNPEEATTDEFIQFVDKTGKSTSSYRADLSGITMDFELDVTPDAELQMIFDSQLGDVIKSTGNGTLKMEISTLGEFKMFGTYVIEKGSYTFTSMNIFAKPFQLRNGSRIIWTGDPLNAQIDMEAVYAVKASTSALMSNVEPSGGATGGATQASQKVPVEAIIYLKNKLFEPDIKFGVNVNTNDLPADANLGLLNATIQQIQNNQQEAARQVVSLLVTGNFVPPSNVQNTAGGPSLSSGINNSVGDLISSQLSNWLSQIIPGWEVNLLYRPKDDIQQQSQFITTLTTRWLNDRLIVEGSFDAENPYTPSGSIQYNLRKDGKFRARAFSRAQSNPVLQQNVVTQGVSLMYRAEFDRIQLFRRKKKEPTDSTGKPGK